MSKRLYRNLFFLLAVILLPAAITYLMNEEGAVSERSSAPEEYYIVSGQEKMPIEEYLTGTVAYYMPVTYEDEAYKAMAVLLRTYVRMRMGEEREINEDQLSLPRYQMEELQAMFGEDFSYTYSRYQTAVQQTRGEVMRCDGELIEPYFHQVSAGMTNSLKGCLYLSSVDSSWDIQAESFLSLLTMSAEEFYAGLLKASGSENVLLMEEASAEEFMDQLVVEGREGEYKQAVVWNEIRIPASKVQDAFGLKSPAFSFEAYEGRIRILTKGIGHGLGLSLYGAEHMASEGKSYREILAYYYSNITVSGE